MTFNVKFFNRTLAHELGHGAFAWQHPFDEPFKNEQGATRNLMDYVTDDDLVYFQWQIVHFPFQAKYNEKHALHFFYNFQSR